MPDNAKINKTTNAPENTCGYIPTYNNAGDFTGYKTSEDHKNCIEGYECCSPLHSPPPPPDDDSLQDLVFSPCTESFGRNLLRTQGNVSQPSEATKPAANRIYVRVPLIHKLDNDRYCLSNKWTSGGIRIMEGLGWGGLEIGGWYIHISHLPISVRKPIAVPVLLGNIMFDGDDVLASVQISAYDPNHAYWLSTSNLYQNNGLVTGILIFDDWIINVSRPTLEAKTSCCK